MKRWTLAALAAVTLFSTTALAGTPQAAETAKLERRSEATRYADTTARWRGGPTQRVALSHPTDQGTASEKVYELLPSVNFVLEGQSGGAFVVPGF